MITYPKQRHTFPQDDYKFPDGPRRQREHVLRSITIRTNDGTNQCQPANAWMKIINRIANRRTN